MISRKSPSRVSRSKNGCLSCRTRRKKCSETHPVCSLCQRLRLACTWPELQIQHHKGFPTKEVEQKLTVSVKSIKQSVVSKQSVNVELDLQMSTPDGFEALRKGFGNPSLQTSETNPNMKYFDEIRFINYFANDHFFSIEDDLKEDDQISIRSGGPQPEATDLHIPEATLQRCITVPVLSTYTTWIPGNRLSRVEAKMYHSFIHRFVPSITLPYAHSALKAYSVAVPHVTNNSMVLDLFVACGALVMGFGNAATRDESLKYYRCCVMNLKTQINNQKINGTESWLLSALPILLIFEKHRGTSVTKSMKHLHGLYLMIKEREKQKMLTGGPKLGMVPDERSSLESFLYHYATGILFVSDEGLKKYLPRGVFRHLLKSLITPIYRSEIVWVNNPVLGGSIFLFEIVERISWFFRQHSSTGICDADEGNGLLKELDDWRFPGMPDTLAGLSEGRSLKAHHDAAMVWKNGARILLLKALHPDISENDIRIRTCVDDGRNWLEKIPLGGDTGCTGCTIFWPIAMIGCASTRQEDREFIRNMSTGLAEVVFSVSSYQLLDLCMHAWGEKTEFPERGLDVLYNRNIMDNYYL